MYGKTDYCFKRWPWLDSTWSCEKTAASESKKSIISMNVINYAVKKLLAGNMMSLIYLINWCG
jgi:hypothetical protein